ncbi:MAG: hypothetical protein INH43_05775 [Acidobacteriaceae bacterium]|nr:hypothetical protein [Acidobacteriaceae bacterium]
MSTQEPNPLLDTLDDPGPNSNVLPGYAGFELSKRLIPCQADRLRRDPFQRVALFEKLRQMDKGPILNRAAQLIKRRSTWFWKLLNGGLYPPLASPNVLMPPRGVSSQGVQVAWILQLCEELRIEPFARIGGAHGRLR